MYTPENVGNNSKKAIRGFAFRMKIKNTNLECEIKW